MPWRSLLVCRGSPTTNCSSQRSVAAFGIGFLRTIPDEVEDPLLTFNWTPTFYKPQVIPIRQLLSRFFTHLSDTFPNKRDHLWPNKADTRTTQSNIHKRLTVLNFPNSIQQMDRFGTPLGAIPLVQALPTAGSDAWGIRSFSSLLSIV